MMKEEAIIFFALFAIAFIPMVCLIVSHWKAIIRGFVPMGVIGCAFVLKCIANGSTKPPTPPGPPTPPPSEDVKVEVVAISTKSITISPDIPSYLVDMLYGKRCQVQIKRNAGAWETVAEIESYGLEPRVIDGLFVSGGAKTIRRVRLYWPDVDQSVELPQ